MAPTQTSRSIQARRVAFDVAGVPRHYVAGDLLASHLVTLGSAVFPEGEDFFVRTVRAYRDEIVDPELRQQVAGFIGQEAMHGREHRRLNERLAELGYPVRFIDRFTKLSFAVEERLLPRSVQLAITAALEHYTATLAEVLLTNPEARARFAHDEVRNLFLWHALEESEHKAVAFDVFRAVSGDERIRIGVMRAVTATLAAGMVAGLAISLATDPAGRSLRALRASWEDLKRSPFADRRVLDRLRDYNRRGFHPDDHDTSALVAEWRERLLAGNGPLAGRAQGAA